MNTDRPFARARARAEPLCFFTKRFSRAKFLERTTHTRVDALETEERKHKLEPQAYLRILRTAYRAPRSQVFLLKSYSSASASRKDGGDTMGGVFGGTGVSEEDRRALDTCRNLLTRRGLESTGAIPCVSPECGNWMVPEGGVQRVKCASCLVEFCGR